MTQVLQPLPGAPTYQAASPAVVIVHPEMGIYLGLCFGLGFWSKLDPVGQTSAVCFDDEPQAREHIATWEEQPEGVTFVAVRPDEISGRARYASVHACIAAGLEAWDPSVPSEGPPAEQPG